MDGMPPKSYIEEKVDWCVQHIMRIEQQLEHVKPSSAKPWYRDVMIWFCILMVVVTIGIVYIFYLSEVGWNVDLPAIMSR